MSKKSYLDAARTLTEVGPRKRLPDWIVAEIPVETIRSCPVVPSIEDVAGRLAKRGSTISWDQVGQVFEEYEPEKKLRIDCHSTTQAFP